MSVNDVNYLKMCFKKKMPQPNPMAIFENHPPTQHNGILAKIYNPGLNGALGLYEKRWLYSVKDDSYSYFLLNELTLVLHIVKHRILADYYCS